MNVNSKTPVFVNVMVNRKGDNGDMMIEGWFVGWEDEQMFIVPALKLDPNVEYVQIGVHKDDIASISPAKPPDEGNVSIIWNVPQAAGDSLSFGRWDTDPAGKPPEDR